MERRNSSQIRQVWTEQVAITNASLNLCKGVIVNNTGDGHICRFESASHAILCGWLMQKYTAERNDFQSDELLKFSIYVGIDVGEVLEVGAKEWRGNVKNRAARVTSECPAGEVYFTSRVSGLLDDRAIVKELVEGEFTFKGVSGKTVLYRVTECIEPLPEIANPFHWRGAITDIEAFQSRRRQIAEIKGYLMGGQNAQIVGERRIGKSSLMRYIQSQASGWADGISISYVDLTDARCRTSEGLLAQIAFGWKSEKISNLIGLTDIVEKMTTSGKRPLLLIDEFGEFTRLQSDFAGELMRTLRSCGEAKMLSTVTSSRRPLSELVSKTDPSSPFFNTFPTVRVRELTDNESQEFVKRYRPGIRFSQQEQSEILRFAKNHPLKIMSACYFVILAQLHGGSLEEAIQLAEDQTREAMQGSGRV